MNNIRMILLVAATLLLPFTSLAADYVIGEGDVLDVAVWGVKELNASVRVRPDGKITIPGLGEVVASGFSPKALQLDLATRLKEMVKNPIVTVTVREITNSRVYVFGSGVNPGVHDLNRRTTLLQLLCTIGTLPSPVAGAGAATSATATSAAGTGAGQSATVGTVPDFKKAYVLRNGKKIKEDFTRLFINGEVGEDILIETNDAIFIPRLPDSNIYVLGAVNSPRSIEFREGMKVMEAILDCGGFTKFADQNDVIIRRKDGKEEVSLRVKAKKLFKEGDLSQNIALKAGDYVLVKESFF